MYLGGAQGPTVLGTINVMCAAVLAEGDTTLVGFNNFFRGNNPSIPGTWFPSAGLVGQGPENAFQTLKNARSMTWSWTPLGPNAYLNKTPATDNVSGGLNDQLEKLTGVYRVLIPRKIAAYTYHLNGTSPITDAPTIRWLRFILIDEVDDQCDGELLLQSLLRTPADVERAANHQRRLEELMVAAGGIAGPGSIGDGVDG